MPCGFNRGFPCLCDWGFEFSIVLHPGPAVHAPTGVAIAMSTRCVVVVDSAHVHTYELWGAESKITKLFVL